MKLKHPLATLFVPISMIVAIAASSVTVALTYEDVDRTAITTTVSSADIPESVAAVQPGPEVS
jgi:hypothetical protein